jgi:hypothetical protein
MAAPQDVLRLLSGIPSRRRLYSNETPWRLPHAPHTTAGNDPSRFLRFDMALPGGDTASVSWLLTGSGDLFPGSAVPTDSFKRHQEQERAAAPDLVKLGELPPAGPSTK